MEKLKLVWHNLKTPFCQPEIDWKNPKDLALFVFMCGVLLGTAAYVCTTAHPVYLSVRPLIDQALHWGDQAPNAILGACYSVSVIVVVGGIYMFPLFVAFIENHSQAQAIGFVWLLFGGSWVGWICCLIWACNDPKKVKQNVLQKRETIQKSHIV